MPLRIGYPDFRLLGHDPLGSGLLLLLLMAERFSLVHLIFSSTRVSFLESSLTVSVLVSLGG
jgi:hypothetical protein